MKYLKHHITILLILTLVMSLVSSVYPPRVSAQACDPGYIEFCNWGCTTQAIINAIGAICCGGTACGGYSYQCWVGGVRTRCQGWGQCSPSGAGCAAGCSTPPTITINTSFGAQVTNNNFVGVNTTTLQLPLSIELSQCLTATYYQITAQYLRPDNTYRMIFDSLTRQANPTLDFTNRWTRWKITGQSGWIGGMNGVVGELYFYPVKVIARILSFTQDSALINWEVGLPPGLIGNPNIYLNLGSTDTLIRSYTTSTFTDSDGLSQYQGTYLISGPGLNLKDNLYRWSLKMSLDGGTTKTVISSGKLPRVALFRVAFPTGPWIQTIGGDVHSNIRIHTPGGP